MNLLSLIVALIVIGLVFWVIRTLSGAFGIPPPIVTVIYVLFVVLVVFWLLQTTGLLRGGPILSLE